MDVYSAAKPSLIRSWSIVIWFHADWCVHISKLLEIFQKFFPQFGLFAHDSVKRHGPKQYDSVYYYGIINETMCKRSYKPTRLLNPTICPSVPQSLVDAGPLALQPSSKRRRHHVGLHLHQKRPHGHLIFTLLLETTPKIMYIF